ncbi:hypothetical protein ACFQYP_65460 [Nonomuraea antimicrobica]
MGELAGEGDDFGFAGGVVGVAGRVGLQPGMVPAAVVVHPQDGRAASGAAQLGQGAADAPAQHPAQVGGGADLPGEQLARLRLGHVPQQ